MKKLLSIIIPVYNEQETIHELVERVCNVDLGGIEKEVIIADDGSTDQTPVELEHILQTHPQVVRVYTLPINLGKGAAVRLGMNLARGDILIIQDADLELNPAEYPRLIEPILQGKTDVVYGSRFLSHNPNIPLRTRLANRFLTSFTNLLFRTNLTDMETSYKAMRREALQGIRLRAVRFDFEPEITAKLLMKGHQILEVPISYHPRTVLEGKKINWIDGFEAIFTLLRCRFMEH